jgi:phosphoesterase RecJ-like protein
MTEIGDVNARIREKLLACQHALILSHIRPDGDAIGSLIGLGLAMQAVGKKVTLMLEDGLPSKYRFLEGSDLISKSAHEEFDLVIALDCSNKDRLGNISTDLRIDINIDHHITNDNYADVNLVIPEMAATAAILADNLSKWGLPLDQHIASALLMGILTDSIGFRTVNVTPELLRISARLIESGADMTDLYNRTLVSQTYPSSVLWGLALGRLQRENGLIWTVITLEDRKQAGYAGRDDADLTNLLSAIEGSEISILFNEEKDDKVKVSWRSNASIDVSRIAQFFGGGGHPPAAGADMSGSLDEVRNKVLDKSKQMLKELKSKGEAKK